MRNTAGRPLFSVVINTFNYGRYIGEAIDSVIGQSFPQEDIEIIVVDDGSTDDTSERVRRYGDRIQYIYKTNGGQASALNAGFERARGEIISFLDSDDYWHPDKLLEVAREFERSGSMDFVYHFMDVVDEGRNKVDRYVFPDPGEGRYIESYLRGNLPWFSPTSGMSVRKSCLGKTMPLPEDFRIAADIHLHYVLPFYLRELSLLKKPLGYYRLHGGNLSGGNLLTPEKLRREQSIIVLNREYAERHARKLGYDSRLIAGRLSSMEEVYGIYILSAEGQRWSALRKAFFFRSFLPDDSMLYRAARRLTLCVSAVLSPAVNLRLQRAYRKAWYMLVRPS